jgi:hypothetical protein
MNAKADMRRVVENNMIAMLEEMDGWRKMSAIEAVACAV